MGDAKSAIEPNSCRSIAAACSYSHKCAAHNKRYTNDVLAKTPSKVQWPLFGRSADCTRAHRENSVPVLGCALLRPPGAPTRCRHLPNCKIKQSLRRSMTGEVDVGGRLAEELHNLIKKCPPASRTQLVPGSRHPETQRPFSIQAHRLSLVTSRLRAFSSDHCSRLSDHLQTALAAAVPLKARQQQRSYSV